MLLEPEFYFLSFIWKDRVIKCVSHLERDIVRYPENVDASQNSKTLLARKLKKIERGKSEEVLLSSSQLLLLFILLYT